MDHDVCTRARRGSRIEQRSAVSIVDSHGRVQES